VCQGQQAANETSAWLISKGLPRDLEKHRWAPMRRCESVLCPMTEWSLAVSQVITCTSVDQQCSRYWHAESPLASRNVWLHLLPQCRCPCTRPLCWSAAHWRWHLWHWPSTLAAAKGTLEAGAACGAWRCVCCAFCVCADFWCTTPLTRAFRGGQGNLQP
jgi:hypothetical protein